MEMRGWLKIRPSGGHERLRGLRGLRLLPSALGAEACVDLLWGKPGNLDVLSAFVSTGLDFGFPHRNIYWWYTVLCVTGWVVGSLLSAVNHMAGVGIVSE